MRWLIIGISLAVSSPSMAYDFHSRNATPSQLAADQKYLRDLFKDNPAKAQEILDERARRRKEALRETAFRHMVEFYEDLDRQDDAALSNADVARCNAAIAYYRTIRDDQDALRYEDPVARNP
jgi:alpha-ketoglutarate-dependent taurine dioxygenase